MDSTLAIPILICIVAWIIIIAFMIKTYGKLVINTILGKEEL